LNADDKNRTADDWSLLGFYGPHSNQLADVFYSELLLMADVASLQTTVENTLSVVFRNM